MKIRKVVIEGFHNVIRKEYTFENLNYLYGNNGKGKSTVLQAIQLGILGYIPGTNKTKQGIFSHSNNHTMAVKVFLDDNGNELTIQRVFNKVKNSISESVEIIPESYDLSHIISEIELPLFNFEEFTHMTSNNMKDWFIRYLPKSTFKTDWHQELQNAIIDIPNIDNMVSMIDTTVSDIDGFNLEGTEEIRQANVYFKNKLSFLKSELVRKSGTIQSLVHYDDYVESYTEDQLKHMISDMERQIVDATSNNHMIDRIHTLKNQIDDMQSYVDKVGSIDDVESKLSNIQSELTKIEYQIKQISIDINNTISESKSYDKLLSSDGRCIFTGKACEEIQTLMDSCLETKKELDSKYRVLNSQYNELLNKQSDLKTKMNRLLEHKQSVLSYINRYNYLLEELNRYPKDAKEIDVSNIQLNLETYKDMYGKAIANRQYNALYDTIVKDKYFTEMQIECVKRWVTLTGVNGLQSQTNVDPFEPLIALMNKILKKLFKLDNIECAFNLESKANSFSFGIKLGSTYVPFSLLSSGEKCLYTLALMIGIVQLSNSPLKVIMIDDFLDHLDDNHFESLFNMIKDIQDIQFIFAGIKNPSNIECNVITIV